jgi:glucose-6-phosphate isomerase
VASSLAGEYKNGRNIFEHFFFAKNLENLGKWYRQLLAESVGKIQKDGQSIGITPTTSIGTTDLHSVAQLDLAHTRDRSMAVVSLRSKNSIRI